MKKITVDLVSASDINIVQTLCEITRGANKFQNTEDLKNHIAKHNWDENKTINTLNLPHSKLGRFTDMLFLVSGTSRRFLAQITTHHVGISFMSGSLQYSDWSKRSLDDMFTVPYSLLPDSKKLDRDIFLSSCKESMEAYKLLAPSIGNDDAGYTAPQALRNIIAIKVNLEELRFIASQRLCKRNSSEILYVVGQMCLAVQKTYDLPDDFFMPSCYGDFCSEGKYSCGHQLSCDHHTLEQYLKEWFPLLYEGKIN